MLATPYPLPLPTFRLPPAGVPHNGGRMKSFWPAVLASGVLLAAGCGRHEHAGHGEPVGEHVHLAPHGGTLVEIGEHAYAIELLRDAATGRLTAWVLDGHAENFIRIAPTTLEVVAYSGGSRRTLTLRAVANTATGETVGSTSQFEGAADWVKHGGEIHGEIAAFEIQGHRFPGAAYHLAP